MSDKDQRGGVEDVVSKVTVKALKEFDTGPMEDGRPQSGRQGSRPTSATGSKAGSRPTSAAKERPPSGRPSSKAGSRPTSAVKGSRPPSATGSRPTSAAGLAIQGSRPGSASPKEAESGSRPTSATKGSRPTSAAGKGSRPTSAAGQGSRPTSATGQGSKPGSAAGSRPVSATGQGSRPASATGQGSRPGSAAGQGSRPGSVTGKGSSPPSGAGEGDKPAPVAGQDSPVSATGQGSRPASIKSQERPRSRDGPREDYHDTRAEDPTIDDGPQEDPSNENANNDGGWAEEPNNQEDDFGAMEPPQTDLAGQPGGDPDGDGFSDDEDDFDEEEGEIEESDDESEGENEMVVLDPDHPLMARFQRALKDHLDKQNEKVSLELKELQEAVKNRKKAREDLGVELYGVQQELARNQMVLEQKHDEFADLRQQRNQMDQQLEDVRDMYKDTQINVNNEKKKGAELQAEVENLALRIFYMENAKEDVRSDIAVMKRAAEKAETEVSKAEESKQKQDLYVDRLIERADKLREEIAMYEAQCGAQKDETRAAKDALNEARMEIEGINLEKKQLFQQWSSSLIGMRRRDEAHAAMNEALSQQQQRILSLETEIEGYKRSISKEQEQNEKLMGILSKTDMDIGTVRKQLSQCQAKHDALKNEYSTYTRMLHETEQALNRANTDKTLRLNEVNTLRKQIEKEYLEKVKLEDEILEKMRTQLTVDKASQYTEKVTGKMRLRTRDLEAQVAQVENDISKDTLEVSNTRTRTERLQKVMEELDKEIAAKNAIINRSEAEIVKRNAIIERKQGVIDQYNKKLEQMISQAGGVELGPLEIQINSLQKSIETEVGDINELQQMWLRDQSELVRLAREKEAQSVDVENMKKQLTILSQKKLRIEGEINKQHTDTADIERNIRNMQNDMLKLNMLLHREKGIGNQLEQDNKLIEGNFVGSLKEAELDSIHMQENLDSLREEKERLLNSLVESERQIMLWEKKTQLARETKQAVDSEVGQGEIRAMKSEIHRMQVRYTQLMKQQERMIQEMEKSVSRRDTIVTRGDAQAKMNKKTLTKGTFQRQMAELKKKIKHTIQDANSCDNEIQDFRGHQGELAGQLEEKQLNVQQLQSNADQLDADLDRHIELKQKTMAELIAKQQKSKYYQQVKDGKYTRLCRTDATLDAELSKQVDKMQTLTAIVDRLNQEFPHAQPTLRKVQMAYGNRVLDD